MSQRATASASAGKKEAPNANRSMVKENDEKRGEKRKKEQEEMAEENDDDIGDLYEEDKEEEEEPSTTHTDCGSLNGFIVWGDGNQNETTSQKGNGEEDGPEEEDGECEEEDEEEEEDEDEDEDEEEDEDDEEGCEDKEDEIEDVPEVDKNAKIGDGVKKDIQRQQAMFERFVKQGILSKDQMEKIDQDIRGEIDHAKARKGPKP